MVKRVYETPKQTVCLYKGNEMHVDCFPLQLMKTGTRATAMEVLASSQNPTSEHKDIHLNLIVNRQ